MRLENMQDSSSDDSQGFPDDLFFEISKRENLVQISDAGYR